MRTDYSEAEVASGKPCQVALARLAMRLCYTLLLGTSRSAKPTSKGAYSCQSVGILKGS